MIKRTEQRRFKLSDLTNYPLPCDFTFIIDGERYNCHIIKVLAVSKKIQEIVTTKKKNITEYTIENIKDPQHYFADFIKMLNGEKITINLENATFFNEIAKILNISYLADKVSEIINAPKSSQNEAIFAKSCFEHGLDYSNHVKYLAENWRDAHALESVMHLPLKILDEIVQHSSFRVTSESEFFEWIEAVVKRNGRSYVPLFGHVFFPKLRRHHIKHLLQLISYDEVNQFVLQELDERLITEIIMDSEEEEEEDSEYEEEEEEVYQQAPSQAQHSQWDNVTFGSTGSSNTSSTPHEEQTPQFEVIHEVPYIRKNELRGVVKYFQDEYDDDYLDFICATGGGTKTSKISNIFEFTDTKNSWWDNYDVNIGRCSKENAWCMIELKSSYLKLQAYTLASPSKNPGYHQPKSWRIETSVNGKDFTIVHSVTNCTLMNAPYPICTFVLKNETEPVRFIRLILTENYAQKNSSNSYELSLSAFEVYGKIGQYRK